MKLHVLVILLVAQFLFAELPYNCLIRKDSVLFWETALDFVYIQVSTPSRFGYSSIGFSSTNTTKDALLFLSYVNNSTYHAQEYENHFQVARVPHQVDYTFESIYPIKLRNVYYTFGVSVNNQDLFNRSHVLLAYHSTSQPKNWTIVPSHEVIQTIQVDVLTQENYGCFISYSNYLEGEFLLVEIFSLSLDIVLLIFCFLMRNKQPLVSRGVMPFVALVSHFVFYCLHIPYFIFDLEWKIQYMCFVHILQNSALQSSYVLIPIAFFRYLLIINLNKQKKDIYLSMSKKDQFPLVFKFLNWITSKFVSIVFCIAYTLFWIVMQLISIIPDNFQCTSRFHWLSVYTFAGFTLFVTCSILILQIFDFSQNWIKILKCRIKQIFVDDDPFYFRLELISIILLIPFYGVAHFGDISRDIKAIMNSVIFFWILWIQVIFVVLITSLKWICSKKSSIQQHEIESMLAVTELKEMFVNFSKKEWSLENLLLWEDIHRYKQITNEKQRMKYATFIHEKYLNGIHSPFEVNVESKSINDLLQDISNDRLTEISFDCIESEIFSNLLDILGRFKNSEEYKVYERNESMQLALLYREK